jgi:copper chaperone CopZ
MIKKKYNVKGMHCTSCAMTIEWELEDIGAKAKCSYASAELEVEYDPETITHEKIVAAVKKAGYVADTDGSSR